MSFELGQKVMLVRDVDRYPDFVAPVGEIGTVTTMCDGLFGVTMDEPVSGCEPWDNEVQWTEHNGLPDADLVILHGRNDCDESCHSCADCYVATGDTVCDRSCPHAYRNHPDGEAA